MREKLGVLNLEVIPYTEAPEYVERGWVETVLTLTGKEIIFTFADKHAIIPVENITEIHAITDKKIFKVKKNCIAIGYKTQSGEKGYALIRGPELLISALRCALIVLSGTEIKVEQPLSNVEKGLVLLLFLNVKNKKTQEFLLATFGKELQNALESLKEKGYIDSEHNLTPKGIKFLRERESSQPIPTAPAYTFTFPEAAQMFGMGVVLEAKMRYFLKTFRVPRKYIRMFFEQAEKSELLDFLTYYIKKMGIGDMKVHLINPFKLSITIENNSVPKIYHGRKDLKSCFVLTQFFYRLFSECLQLSSSVREMRCINEDADACEFEVEFQPLNLYLTILNEEDIQNLRNIDEGTMPETAPHKFYEALKLTRGKGLTENGEILLRYASNYPIEKWEDFPPPWHLEKIDPRIATDPEFRKLFEEAWKRIEK